jgi:O-antigen/teichoic acid export membrane protein
MYHLSQHRRHLKLIPSQRSTASPLSITIVAAEMDAEPLTQPESKPDELSGVGADEIAPSVRKSLLLSFTERYLAFIVQIATMAILARLLSPADYGVYTVAAVTVSLTQTLRDFGSIGFILQERELTPARVRTVYGVSLVIGCLAAACVIAASGKIADFYQNDTVRNALLVLSINFLLLPYASLILVLLRRDMQFDTLLKINFVSVLANCILAIILARLGFAAMSLAWGSVAGSIATCIMGMATRRSRPYGLSPTLSEWRRVVSFGTIATASVLVSSIGEEAPDLIVGRFLGVEALGLYGRASGIVAAFNRLISSSIAPVAVSALALRHRSGAEMRSEFITGTTMITGVAWPFFAFLGLMAFPIVRILCGDAWDAAVPVARILSISGAIAALANLNQLALQAKGAVKESLKLHLLVQPIVIGAIVLGAQFDLRAVGGAFIFGSIVFLIASYRYLDKLIGVSLVDVVVAARASLVVTATSSIGPAIVLAEMSAGESVQWIPLALASASAVIGWLVGILLSHHLLARELMDIMAVARRRLRGC